MNATQMEINQKICDDMTQLQIDLDRTLKNIFEQAGSKIKPEKQEEVKKGIEHTKLLLENFKSRYWVGWALPTKICPIYSGSPEHEVQEKAHQSLDMVGTAHPT